jgi:tyrosinase
MPTTDTAAPVPTAEAPVLYRDVQALLKKAAPAEVSPYAHGGLGAFWELDRDGFVAASLYDQPLIAPEDELSCCGVPLTGAPPRSARSLLIKGLAGQAPFDGSQYTPLPWGGSHLARDDIERIARWIDDGCPDRNLASLTVDIDSGEPAPRIDVKGLAGPVYDVLTGDPNTYLYQQGEPLQRMSIDCMSPDQIERLRLAFRGLYDLNNWPADARSYNNMALIHQNHCQHGWERFLPWHRVYLYEFEQALRSRRPDVTMPYWDFTADRYVPEEPGTGQRIPLSFMAFLTVNSLTTLREDGVSEADIEKLKPIAVPKPETFYSQQTFFRRVSDLTDHDYSVGDKREAFLDALLESNSFWYPLRYPGEYTVKNPNTGKPEVATINKAIHYHYPTKEDIQQILSLRTFRDFGGGGLYNDSFGMLDQNPHNTMHIWTGGMNPQWDGSGPAGVRVIGRRYHQREDLYSQPQFGDMFSNLTASFDPIFWPIHSNIDRVWWEWQQSHPDASPSQPDAVLTPWGYTVRDTLDIHQFGYEYVKSTHIVPVGLTSPVGRFRSCPIVLPEAVHKSFGTAEVRLHRVPQLPRSCFVRVFLNNADADASTPLDRNVGYAGYFAIFGHGPCYGGPGHCDIPPSASAGRPGDARQRTMNTPRNHRVDVTAAIRRQIAMGFSQVTITLVVIGADYEEEKDLLRLDGVSLNFHD